MAYEHLTRSHYNNLNGSALYCKSVDVGDGETSDDFILPVAQITGIGALVDTAGTAALHFTFDPPEAIEDESADWYEWNGTDPISLSITGFRLVSTSGAATAKVTLRTLNG